MTIRVRCYRCKKWWCRIVGDFDHCPKCGASAEGVMQSEQARRLPAQRPGFWMPRRKRFPREEG